MVYACASWVGASAELFLGSACPGCGRPGWGLCPECAAVLADRRELRWEIHAKPAVAAARYEGVWRSALVAYKEQGAWGLSRPLGAALAWSVAGLLARPEPVVLVPVPSARAAIHARGEDVTLRLAREASRLLRHSGVPAAAAGWLRQSRPVDDQSGLDAAARRRNLAGGLRAVPRAGGRPAVAVDDITTTGATLQEAVRALMAAGVPILGAAVVAATPRRLGSASDAAASR